MDYNAVRALCERWLAGETTLAEERELKEFFGGVRDGLPRDLEAWRPLFGQSAGSAAEGPRRRLALHIEPAAAERTTANARRAAKSENGRRAARPSGAIFTLRRVAAAVAVVAIVATVGVVATRTEPPHPAGDILCVVDGVRLTDPAAIELHTRRTLEMIDDNLHKPERTLSRQLDGVGELLDRFSNEAGR